MLFEMLPKRKDIQEDEEDDEEDEEEAIFQKTRLTLSY